MGRGEGTGELPAAVTQAIAGSDLWTSWGGDGPGEVGPATSAWKPWSAPRACLVTQENWGAANPRGGAGLAVSSPFWGTWGSLRRGEGSVVGMTLVCSCPWSLPPPLRCAQRRLHPVGKAVTEDRDSS